MDGSGYENGPERGAGGRLVGISEPELSLVLHLFTAAVNGECFRPHNASAMGDRMLQFEFFDAQGVLIFIDTQTPTHNCRGGCCFDNAVAAFQKSVDPTWVPGKPGVVIKTTGV